MSSNDAVFWQAVELIDAGETHELLAHLRAYPWLIGKTAPPEDPAREAYFAEPTLVHYLPNNPNRIEKVSPAVVDCLDVLVGMGAAGKALDETLGLAASSSSLSDSGQMMRLITALVQAGAKADSGVDAALSHKMVEALFLLLRLGAAKSLPVRAALGEPIEAEEIKPGDDLQKALAVAAIWGQAAPIDGLLAAGADPNRFCPEGFHAHSTPLHQAVWSDSPETLQKLIAGGADRSIKDTIWDGTPLDWARHGEKPEMVDRLTD